MATPVFRTVASAYLAVASLLLTLLPAAAAAYLWVYQPEAPRFVEHDFHIWGIGSVVAISSVLALIALRCYLEGGERLTRYLALGFTGFSLSYALHGVLTPLAESSPALFLLPGPTSRLMMSACVLIGVMGHGHPADPVEKRRQPSLWVPQLVAMVLFLQLTLWIATAMPVSPQTWRYVTEGGAGILSAIVLLVLPLRGVRGPMLWYHAIAMAWMFQSSGCFILAAPWNHMWWLAHIVSLGGFLFLGYGLAQAAQSSSSFADLYSPSRAFADLSDMKRTQDMLEQAIARADQANMAKSRFLASASHDLRQPVQSLMLFIALLETFSLDERARTVVRNLGNAVQALKSLLDGLLDISRLDAGVIEPNLVSFDLRPMLTSLSEEYSLSAARKGLSLGVASPALWLHSDPSLLERILRNLIENAIKYTDQGGVAIDCRVRDGMARLELRDTGIGIPEDQREMVFDEFHQLNNPERDRSKGLGLGLAIVRRLVKLLGVSLDMQSSLGKGTSFTLSVPVGKQPALEPANEDTPLGRRGLALVIEDDEAVLAGLTLLLEHWGWRVLSGAEPRDILHQLKPGEIPDLALSDYRLRDELTGIQALAEICDRLGTSIPTILLTGDTAPERMSEAVQSGFLMLHKPVTSDGLLRALRIVMAAPQETKE
ncbi:MAG TPA: ATP-binding protein [Candidatus Sulfotelmatobacter sp.]|jgi:signal transduction histidine kinase/CheY-like chemotaxis protein|nr:ATP-binding protein [Candidatus Sulfotelmatobacter sp.]